MHKTTMAKSCKVHPEEGRLLARVLAEELWRVRGQELGVPLDYLVTGEVRRDWSDPEFENAPLM